MRALLYSLINNLMYYKYSRRLLVMLIKRAVMKALYSGNNKFSNTSARIQNEKKLMVLSIISSLVRSIEKGNIKRSVSRAVLQLWGDALAKPRNENAAVKDFYAKNGFYPPWFLVISPGHACNLSCSGCYASSAESKGAKLDLDIVERLIMEAKKLWGIKLVVFSGGEPFAYRSAGKDILDIVEKNQDILFLAFTNGTLFDSELVSRMAALKNLTPAFSVEGMEEETDSRRGKGTFNKVLGAMETMRKAGVPFGISVTVNSTNIEELLSERFIDFFFGCNGAFYGFFFQYMPIGKEADFTMMPSAQQRFSFWKNLWDIIEEQSIFLIDFWNHGPLVRGCISAGRDGGYFYIDWNGNIMPCVFTPYSAANIVQFYNTGKNLEDIWNLPFFKSIRDWQSQQGHGTGNPIETGNLLMPCPFRDHNEQFMEWVQMHGCKAEDAAAMQNMKDPAYRQKMADYGKELAKFFDPVWKEEYLNKKCKVKS